MKLLLIEDDREAAEYLVENLTRYFSLEWADTAAHGMAKLLNACYDAMILDLNSPEISDLEICRKIRAGGDQAPVIILSDRFKDSRDIVEGLNSGADDCLVKPFNLEVLIARLRALLRRGPTKLAEETISLGPLVINSTARTVTLHNQAIELRRKEYDLLEYLARNVNRVLTRQMILDHVWDSEASGFNNTIDVHIKYLRDKIDRNTDHKMIRTVHGLGYKMVG